MDDFLFILSISPYSSYLNVLLLHSALSDMSFISSGIAPVFRAAMSYILGGNLKWRECWPSVWWSSFVVFLRFSFSRLLQIDSETCLTLSPSWHVSIAKNVAVFLADFSFAHKLGRRVGGGGRDIFHHDDHIKSSSWRDTSKKSCQDFFLLIFVFSFCEMQ